MLLLKNPRSWRDYDRSAGYRHIEVLPLNGAICAEVKGVDLTSPLPVEVKDEVLRAFAENLVIYIRGQERMRREDHLEFARIFGPLQRIPHIFSVDGYPDVQIVERTKDDSRKVVGEGFHNDSSYIKTPPTSVVMRAVDVPSYGGDTAFANLYLAYETLSPAMQRFCEGLTAIHSASKLFGSKAASKNVMMKDMKLDEGDAEVRHPLVSVHPRTGLKHLFLGPVFTQGFEGFAEAESRMLIDFLLAHIAKLHHTGRVHWENGTVLVWDNWAAHHSAIADYQGKYRYLERVTNGGPELRSAGQGEG
jgi:taurine dioxygenase